MNKKTLKFSNLKVSYFNILQNTKIFSKALKMKPQKAINSREKESKNNYSFMNSQKNITKLQDNMIFSDNNQTPKDKNCCNN